MVLDAWLRESSDAEEAAALTAHLVSFKSYPGEEGNVQRAVAAWLEGHGLQPDLQPTAGDRPNVILRVANGSGPTLLLNGHVDTVLAAEGWSGDPWHGWREGERLYGLGACDMKSGVATIMLAARALARRRDLWSGTLLLATVVDEEAYSSGARALVDAGISADYCLVTEPHWDRPVIGAVGKVLVRGDVAGKAAHGSRPGDGISAAVEGARLVVRLGEMRLGTHPRLKATQCLLSYHSGNDQYVITVPETAWFTINRHIIPGETPESVLAEMRTLAASLQSPAHFRFAIDPPYYPPWETSTDHPFVSQFARAFIAERGQPPAFGYSSGVSDANYFAVDLGLPTVEFGPLGGALHQADEWVNIPSLAGTVRVLLRLALSVLPVSARDGRAGSEQLASRNEVSR